MSNPTKAAAQRRDVIQACEKHLSARYLHRQALAKRRLLARGIEFCSIATGLLILIPQFAAKGTPWADRIELLGVGVAVVTALMSIWKLIFKIDDEVADRMALVAEGNQQVAEGNQQVAEGERILRNFDQEPEHVIEQFIQSNQRTAADEKYFEKVADDDRRASARYSLKTLHPICGLRVCPICKKDPVNYEKPEKKAKVCDTCGAKI